MARARAACDATIAIVHGGGKAINEAMEKAGLVPQMVQGRRYTDEETLRIVVDPEWRDKGFQLGGERCRGMFAVLLAHEINLISGAKLLIEKRRDKARHRRGEIVGTAHQMDRG